MAETNEFVTININSITVIRGRLKCLYKFSRSSKGWTTVSKPLANPFFHFNKNINSSIVITTVYRQISYCKYLVTGVFTYEYKYIASGKLSR